MDYTANISLIKPELTDNVTPAQFNENSDILDGLISGMQTQIQDMQAEILQIKSGEAISAVVSRETRAWLEEHGAAEIYVDGTALVIPGGD